MLRAITLLFADRSPIYKLASHCDISITDRKQSLIRSSFFSFASGMDASFDSPAEALLIDTLFALSVPKGLILGIS